MRDDLNRKEVMKMIMIAQTLIIITMAILQIVLIVLSS